MSDLIDRQAVIDALHMHLMYRMGTDSNKKRLDDWINGLPSAQETREKRTETHACDCISRQMLLEYIHGEPVGRLLCDKYNLDGLIEQFPSAQPEPRWTPCSEGLPEKDGRYQVTRYDYVANTEFIDILWYEENLWWNRHSTGDFAVTAWMPRPEPWKGEDDE